LEETAMTCNRFASVPVLSFAESDIGPRFGIRSERMTLGNAQLHRHDYFEVWFFASMAATQRISLREHIARPGSIFFISPMTAHQVRFEPNDSCFVLYFDLAFLRPDLVGHLPEVDADLLARVPELAPFAYQEDIDFVMSGNGADIVSSLCGRMLEERLSPRLCSTDVLRSYLALLLAEVTRCYEDKICSLMQRRPPGGGRERHVRGVIKFISDNLREKLSLTEAAKAVAVSPNYLASLLKRETGRTFVELMTEQRMDRARELLTFTNMRISEIANAIGFDDNNYFCKRFKQMSGCTPLEFRTSHVYIPGNRGVPARDKLVGA
jgi:AraC family transcriptional activator of pobA